VAPFVRELALLLRRVTLFFAAECRACTHKSVWWRRSLNVTDCFKCWHPTDPPFPRPCPVQVARAPLLRYRRAAGRASRSDAFTDALTIAGMGVLHPPFGALPASARRTITGMVASHIDRQPGSVHGRDHALIPVDCARDRQRLFRWESPCDSSQRPSWV
jgi:hypothetical protein